MDDALSGFIASRNNGTPSHFEQQFKWKFLISYVLNDREINIYHSLLLAKHAPARECVPRANTNNKGSLVFHYRKTSNISRTLIGNTIVDNSDIVGASPVGAAPTTSSFST